MAKAYDILLNDDGDLKVMNGDFATGESDAQHVQDILEAVPGDYKQSPLTGAAIVNQIKGPVNGEMKRTIRLQLEADGYKVNQVGMTGSVLTIDAERS